MNKPKDLLELYNRYEEHIQAIHDSKRAKNLLNETRSAVMRTLVVGLGYQGIIGTGKMSLAELNSTKEFMKTQGVEKLKEARMAFRQGCLILQRSSKIQNIGETKLKQLLTWVQEQSWWTEKPIKLDQNCPTPLKQKGLSPGRKITNRRGKNKNYSLPINNISPSLQAELQEFFDFLTAPFYRGRVIEPIAESTAKQYLAVIRLLLGWFVKHQGFSPEELSLSLLVPKLTKDELYDLSKQQQDKRWKQLQIQLATWLCEFLRFLIEVVDSESPRTKVSRIVVLAALGKFIYCDQVEQISDYANIPILKTVGQYVNDASREVKDWQRQKRYVTQQEKKWPEPIPNQTVLTTVHEEVVEPLRQKCRVRSKDGNPRYGAGPVLALQRYLIWSFLAYMPARRQEEYRNLKISLSCPIQRPKDVPPDGLYHPLPPGRKREKRYDGSVGDNYLYKTYSHKGKFYKHGIWILDIQAYKNWKVYGPQSIVIPNRLFDDDTCLYDYLESYLYGYWMPGGRNNQMFYDWWQPELLGCRGRWVHSGRNECNPADVCCIRDKSDPEIWSWGYLFVSAIAGRPLDASKFTVLVQNTARALIGKSLSPHTMRYVWATWAYQLQLDDQKKESLAYAMGHSLTTLKKMYERCTPAEKRRPIEQAIERLIFDDMTFLEQPLPVKKSSASTPDKEELIHRLQDLTPEQRQELLKLLRQKSM
ncbi:hypothetical protein [Nostoc sp. CMAA1605]|uniref:hypothetical protein n=1 Tax=Nostoc sp. CMAA1605 TaxID=2055159 RepID=UPI001F3BE58A|nr:hypothetical protein [Nostoc sp. CMAA1605]MCF4967147.1 hypothetical protein [Nostoc sp. CMAA1605]